MSTLPMIEAFAAPRTFYTPEEIAAKTLRIKSAFGLPKWITGFFGKPQVAKAAIRLSPVGSFASTPIRNLPPKTFVVLTPEQKHNQAVAARTQLAEFSKPVIKTTKTLILNWMEPDKKAHIKDIQAAFPLIASGGISSRVAELTKAGSLVSMGNGVYTLPAA